MANELYLIYHETRTGGEALSNEAWSDHADEYIELEIRGIRKEKNKHKSPYDYNSMRWIETDFDAPVGSFVYLVIVKYTTGDTFGTTYGSWQVIGAYQHVETADAVVMSIHDKTYEGYKFWEGYFESFEDCIMMVLKVD